MKFFKSTTSQVFPRALFTHTWSLQITKISSQKTLNTRKRYKTFSKFQDSERKPNKTKPTKTKQEARGPQFLQQPTRWKIMHGIPNQADAVHCLAPFSLTLEPKVTVIQGLYIVHMHAKHKEFVTKKSNTRKRCRTISKLQDSNCSVKVRFLHYQDTNQTTGLHHLDNSSRHALRSQVFRHRRNHV